MKSLVMVLLIMATLAGSANAHDGMIALFTDSTVSDNDAELPIGENYNLEIFYIQGDGPVMGSACEFRLVLSTPDAEFLEPIWPDYISLTMGDVMSGISIAARGCMRVWHSEYYYIVHIGTVPVRNHADLDTFTVSLVGHPGVNPPAIQITTCEPGFPAYQVQGGTFTFNGVSAAPVAPWLSDACADFPLHVTVLFSEEVTAQTAEMPINYSVFETDDTLNSFSIIDAVLAPDLRTVTLTLDDFLSGYVDNTVRVWNVEDLDGNQISPGSEIDIRITDTTPPALASISLLSDDIIELGFSERVDSASIDDVNNYSVFVMNNPANSIGISEARLSSDRMCIQLFLSSPLAPEVRYWIYIDNIQDWAGNSTTLRLTDQVLIPLSVVHIPVAECTLEEDIQVAWYASDYINGLESTCLYYQPSGGTDWIELCEYNPSNPIGMTIFAGDEIDNGVEYYIVATNGLGSTTYHGTPDDPHVIPACKPNGPWLSDAYTSYPLYVFVVFSEEVTAQSSEIPSNYSVFETTDTLSSFPVADAALMPGSRTVLLVLDDILSGKVGNTVRVWNVEDLAGYQILPGSEIQIRVVDVIPPVLTDISLLSDDAIELEFSEQMDPATAQDAGNYIVVECEDPSNSIQISEVQLSADRMNVQFVMSSPLSPGICYFVHIDNVQDWAGNPVESLITREVIIPLSIIHTPVAECAIGQVIYVLWEVSDDIYGLESTCLYYRQGGGTDWIEQCENNPINPVVMPIPGGDVTDNGLEYYITATNGIGATAYHGTPDDPHVISSGSPLTCDQPMLSLVGYSSEYYAFPLWIVAVEVRNWGPGTAKNVNATMNADIPWLIILDPACSYGDILQGETGLGISDVYAFSLSSYPGGSFNVWFDVTYEDSCGNEYQLRLDPEFDPESSDDGESSEIRTYNLSQNYPNPFNPHTSIDYQIPAARHVEIMIFEASGKLVRTLLDEYREGGRYTMNWDGRDRKGNILPSGIYFYRLQSGSFTDTKKMILLR